MSEICLSLHRQQPTSANGLISRHAPNYPILPLCNIPEEIARNTKYKHPVSSSMASASDLLKCLNLKCRSSLSCKNERQSLLNISFCRNQTRSQTSTDGRGQTKAFSLLRSIKPSFKTLQTELEVT